MLLLLSLTIMAATAPLAASSDTLTLATPTGNLGGTLVVPAGNGPFPLAVIIAGSGPTDRDGNSV
ncbi:MAG TPA: hypothetical protein VII52_02530, partial [Gemmatimonadaceae bacterium]